MATTFKAIGPAILFAAIACEDVHRESPAIGRASLMETATIGVLEGSETEMFGEIDDVEIGEDGSIAVLDEQAIAVTLFGSSGSVLGSYRAAGQGPGEMRRPQDLEFVGDTLFVLDSGNLRIHTLVPAESGLEYAGSIPLDFPAVSLCATHGRIYVHYLHARHLLHEVTRSEEIASSFAPVPEIPESGDALQGSVQFQFMSFVGPVECFEAPEMIVLIGGLSPWIRS